MSETEKINLEISDTQIRLKRSADDISPAIIKELSQSENLDKLPELGFSNVDLKNLEASERELGNTHSQFLSFITRLGVTNEVYQNEGRAGLHSSITYYNVESLNSSIGYFCQRIIDLSKISPTCMELTEELDLQDLLNKSNTSVTDDMMGNLRTVIKSKETREAFVKFAYIFLKIQEEKTRKAE